MNNPNWKNRTMWTGDNLDVIRGMNSESAVEKSTGRFLQGGDMKPIAALLIGCLMILALPVSAVDCEEWNSEKYFEAATVADVAGCLQSGADRNMRNDVGNTPLHWAAWRNKNPAVTVALMEAGADPNVRNDDGVTPLDWAVEHSENPAVIVALLDAGADPKARDKKGKTPWSYAKGRKQLKGSDAYRRLKEGRL